MSPLVYWQLDVFAERPLAGNGVAVFPDASRLTPAAMQALTHELRQFESIFLLPDSEPQVQGARIFTLEEELPFAGHPILGAAALLHHLQDHQTTDAEWTLQLAAKSVRLLTRRQERGFYAQMDQGVAEFAAQLDPIQAQVIAEAFGLSGAQLDRRYPATVVSTGLPYLILPISTACIDAANPSASIKGASSAAPAAWMSAKAATAGSTWAVTYSWWRAPSYWWIRGTWPDSRPGDDTERRQRTKGLSDALETGKT